MKPEDFLEELNECRFKKNVSMLQIANACGRNYRSVRNFFKGRHNTTIYLILDVVDALNMNLVMNDQDIYSHEDALDVIREAFGTKEYLSTSKEIGMSPAGLRGCVLGANSKFSTFMRICEGLNITIKIKSKKRELKEGDVNASRSKLHRQLQS